jgi:hypothetical protein
MVMGLMIACAVSVVLNLILLAITLSHHG